MKYLLDTCCISDFIRGDRNTLEKFKGVDSFDIALSSVSVMELYFGLFINPNLAQKIEKQIDELIKSITVLPFCKEDARCSAEIRSFLKKKGTPIGSYDLLIAGSALNNNLILVTSNEREFKRVPNLTVRNWRIKK